MISRSASIAVLFLIFVYNVFSQTSMNMQLVGQVRTHGTSGYSSCWGYVAPNGNEYAILGTLTGTQIVDITSDTLKEAAFISGPSSGWREMKVYQKYAYVVTEGNGAGLQIIDLDSMKLVNTITTPQVPSGHTISIEGKYLYINGARHANRGIVVLDLSDPVNPAFVGEYQSEYVHDCFIKNDTIYAAAIYGDGLDIIDATNKSNIKRIALVQYPFSGTHNTAVSEDGKYVFTTDEINSDPNQNGNIVRVWDRADITNLKLVGSYVAKPHTIAHNIHVKGNYAYVAHYTEGLRVIDIKNPEIPVEVAFYDTYPGSANTYAGDWGAFPYFQSNKIIASDISGGLFVMKFPGQDLNIPVARAIVSVVDSATNMPIEGVTVEIVGTQNSYLTDVQGKVKFGGLSDTVTLKFSKLNYDFGYESKLQKVTIPFDSTKSLNVSLKALPTGSLNLTIKNSITFAVVGGAKLLIRNTPIAGFSDENGKFRVSQLIAGVPYRVVVSKFGFAVDSSDIVLNPNQTDNIDFTVTANGKDNFEFDLGWTVGSAQDFGVPGQWQRAKPNVAILLGDTLQPGQDHSMQGEICFVTGQSDNVNDNVLGRTTLTSPSFNTAGMLNPSILYWVSTNTSANPIDDTLYVELSNNDGVSWKTVETITGKYPQWLQHRVAVNDYLISSDKMKIRFIARDGGIATTFEAAVDDIEFGDGLVLSVQLKNPSLPLSYSLLQNYPNPFNPSTTISYSIPSREFVILKVYDVLGKEIATLVESEQKAGNYNVTFNGNDVSSGVYFYKLQAGNFSSVKKLLLTK